MYVCIILSKRRLATAKGSLIICFSNSKGMITRSGSKQETQLSLINRATYLCNMQRRGVPLKHPLCDHAELWMNVKDVDISRSNPPPHTHTQMGALGPSAWDWA